MLDLNSRKGITMIEEDDLLAFYIPFGNEENTVVYGKTDLLNPDVLKELFDYCQILEGLITYSGWLFLLKQYGYEKLYEIDKKSGWFDSSTLEQFIEDVDLEIRMVKAAENDFCRFSSSD